MKKLFLIFGVAGFVFTSCVGNPEGEKVEASEAVEVAESEGAELAVNTADSQVEWYGRKVSATHNGDIAITSGTIQVNGDQLVGGKFTLDMTSINNFDMEGEWKEKLLSHLLSDDFFDVENFPQSTFEITGVEGKGVGTVAISGNLTIKDVTKNITFNADVAEISEDSFAASTDFNIEREDWGITYPGMPDDLISKEINFKINLIAN